MNFSKVYLIFLLIPVFSFAQKNIINTEITSIYKEAYSLFEKKIYVDAQKLFAEYISKSNNPADELSINAKYYEAVCALELFNKDAEYLLMDFIREYPESPKVKVAYFQLGKYFYRKRKYKDAIFWLEKVDKYDLTVKELAEYYFKLAYSYFQNNEYDKAAKNFFEIKDVDTPFSNAAKYYYAHIAYKEKKYESALIDFLKLKNHRKFGLIVPYYISQIYYLQGKYDKLLSYAPALLDSVVPKRTAEITKLVGEAYYEKKEYKKAIPYLEKYLKLTENKKRIDYYELGYSYIKTGECNKAALIFEKMLNKDDSLSQIAYYNLGQCFLSNDKKNYAREAFKRAYKINNDKKLSIDALFLYAKLSFELDYHPYNETVKALEKFLNTNPKSDRKNEAYQLLTQIYLTTKNYDEAISSIERIKEKNLLLEQVYQKLTYNKAVQSFNDKNYEQAISYFDKSLKFVHNKKLEAAAYFWKAESYYNMKKFKQALDLYYVFLFKQRAINLPFFNELYYSMGYTYYKMGNYENAAIWFRKYLLNEKNNIKKLTDASLRTADCFFINKKFFNSIPFYEKAIKYGSFDSDYALYQKSMALGFEKKFNDKIKSLEELLQKYPNSNYADDALMEIAETFLLNSNYNNAIRVLKDLIDKYPSSILYPDALLKIGLAYYNIKNDDFALQYFKKVIDKFPYTTQSYQALESIRKIYIDKGNLDEFEKFIASLHGMNISNSKLDSTAYEIAENRYLEGNCNSAVESFNEYLNKFPDGIFSLPAHFYRAECFYKINDCNSALLDYEYVLSKHKNIFTLNSIKKAANCARKLNLDEKAIDMYKKLEELSENNDDKFLSQFNLMNLYFNAGKFTESQLYAEKVLKYKKLSESKQYLAHLIIAKSAMETGNFALAEKEFKQCLTAKNEIEAEARYYIAELSFYKNDYINTEKMVFSLVNQEPSYDYWIAKAFLLLAKSYKAKGDNFQAKITLKNILENYHKDNEIINNAKKLLTSIETEEEAEQEKIEKATEYNEIKFNDEIINYDELFEDEN